MKIDYLYRFKTEKEFIKEYGRDWERFLKSHGPNWSSEMEHLFGKPFTVTKDELNMNDIQPINNRWNDPESSHDWKISWVMLTKNTQIPTYKPKKIIRTI